MTELVDAIEFVRDRLLLATAALVDGDEGKASDELKSAASRLRSVLVELRA